MYVYILNHIYTHTHTHARARNLAQVNGDKSTEQQADVIQSLADAKFEVPLLSFK